MIHFLEKEIYAKPPKKIHLIIKSDVYYLDDTWNLDLLDMKYYGP